MGKGVRKLSELQKYHVETQERCDFFSILMYLFWSQKRSFMTQEVRGDNRIVPILDLNEDYGPIAYFSV